jgi:NADH-quinone oxidoreductase subunit N
MFYLVSYALMTLGAFGVVMLVSARGEEQTSLTAYAGLSKRSPLLAGLMTLFLLSLAGIPPTVGFVAKVGVFSAAIRAGHTSLALVGVVASVVAAFFYLRVIVLMYFSEPAADGPAVSVPGAFTTAAITLGVLITLLLGIVPSLALGWASAGGFVS